MAKPAVTSSLKAIITGATTGIGLHTLKRLVNSESFDYIIGIGRDVQKCQNAFKDLDGLEQSTNVEFVECDLTKTQSVKEFATTVIRRIPKIDLLINVAGVMDAPKQFIDGVEIHFASNHLGHFLLTKLLLPHMAVDSRIINVTSGLYTKCVDCPTYENVHEPAIDMNPRSYYSQSKLANCLFTVALNDYIKENKDKLPNNVKTFAVRPGFIRGTELGRYHNKILTMLAYPLIYMFSKDLDFGTETIVFLSLEPIDALQSGALYYDKKVEDYTNLVNSSSAKRLWELSEKLLDSSEHSDTSSNVKKSSIESN